MLQSFFHNIAIFNCIFGQCLDFYICENLPLQYAKKEEKQIETIGIIPHVSIISRIYCCHMTPSACFKCCLVIALF